MKDYYSILGLENGASLEEIKIAYREYAKKFHPDKHNGDEFFKERFQEVQEAYEYLIKIQQHQQPIPEIISFHVSKKEILIGEFIEVSWNTKNAKEVSIVIFRGNKYEDLPYFNLDESGKKKFKISDFDDELRIVLALSSFSEKYDDIVSEEVIVKRKRPIPEIIKSSVSNNTPVIKSFYADESSIIRGDKITIYWDVNFTDFNIDLWEIENNGNKTIRRLIKTHQSLAQHGSLSICISDIGKYSLELSGKNSSIHKNIEIRVMPDEKERASIGRITGFCCASIPFTIMTGLSQFAEQMFPIVFIISIPLIIFAFIAGYSYGYRKGYKIQQD